VETLFEWDSHKASANLRKHGISFAAARLIFADPHAVIEQDRIVEGEPRWLAIGVVPGRTTMLAVAHLWDERQGQNTIRIISARRANKTERRSYEEQAGENFD
jgi:uncharacterized DUF497 family protein